MARFSGNAGAVYVGAVPVKVADIYDWQWEANTELRDASIKMDVIERFVPSHGTGYKFTPSGAARAGRPCSRPSSSTAP